MNTAFRHALSTVTDAVPEAAPLQPSLGSALLRLRTA
jgi:hypothetical protein